MLKPLKKLMNAKKTSTKLLILADKVETYKDFDQSDSSRCVIAIGLRLFGGRSSQDDITQFAKDFGITSCEAWSLYTAWYSDLGIGEKLAAACERVTAKRAARVLRKLANKYKRKGN
jgi:hypothetical protein